MDLVHHVNKVVEFMKNAGQNTPDTLTTPSESELLLRAKLILEEALELIVRGCGVRLYLSENYFDSGKMFLRHDDLNIHDFKFVAEEKPDIVEAMDGAADLFWVGVAGTSIIFGCSLEPVLNEVNASNASKFIDGHRNADGKWVKGPSYKPADVQANLFDRVPF
jgi:predicted HAD superfamily Cof-like phosphohydrolase